MWKYRISVKTNLDFLKSFFLNIKNSFSVFLYIWAYLVFRIQNIWLGKKMYTLVWSIYLNNKYPTTTLFIYRVLYYTLLGINTIFLWFHP